MRRLAAALTTVLVALLLPVATPAQAATLPPKSVWLSDVKKAMYGSQAYLSGRVANKQPQERLAVVLDIDNTSIATKYAYPEPVVKTLAFAKYAVRKDVAVFFVTGRKSTELRSIRRALTNAGYRFVSICGRKSGERVAVGKQRCRSAIRTRGYTITANIGNRSTDFEGGNYERAFRLPNYGNALS